MTQGRIPKQHFLGDVIGVRKRGRPRRKRLEEMEGDLRATDVQNWGEVPRLPIGNQSGGILSRKRKATRACRPAEVSTHWYGETLISKILKPRTTPCVIYLFYDIIIICLFCDDISKLVHTAA